MLNLALFGDQIILANAAIDARQLAMMAARGDGLIITGGNTEPVRRPIKIVDGIVTPLTIA